MSAGPAGVVRETRFLLNGFDLKSQHHHAIEKQTLGKKGPSFHRTQRFGFFPTGRDGIKKPLHQLSKSVVVAVFRQP